MSSAIPSEDRLENAEWNLPDHSDKTIWDAENFMLIWDKLMNGQYPGFKLPMWDVSGRPTIPENGMIGINTQIGVVEYYNDGEWNPLGLQEII